MFKGMVVMAALPELQHRKQITSTSDTIKHSYQNNTVLFLYIVVHINML